METQTESQTRITVSQLYKNGQKEAAYDLYKNSGYASKPVMSFEDFAKRMNEPVSQEIKIIRYFYLMAGIGTLTLLVFGFPAFFGK